MVKLKKSEEDKKWKIVFLNMPRKKEFTQDIVIAWLINCYKYEETREIGKYFIEKFIFENKEEVEEITRDANTQYNKIDVYTEIKTNKDVYSIIFENKEETFLHDKQLEKYIEKIYHELKKDKKNNKIIIIVFKSGNIFPFEKTEYENQIKECKKKYGNDIIIIDKLRNLEDFSNALEKDTNNYILNLIIDAYNKKENNNKENINWMHKKTKEEWNNFIEEIKKELDNKNIKFILNSNVKERGNYRTLFEIKDKEFLNISNRIMSNCKWGYCIDWGETTVIKFTLDGPNGYKQYKEGNMTAEDSTFVKKRLDLICFLKNKLNNKKDNLNVGKNDIRTFSIVVAHITSENMSSKNVINKMIFMKEKVENMLKEYSYE